MKKFLMLILMLAAFAAPNAAFADDHSWDNGDGNDGQSGGVIDDGASHTGDDAS